MSNKDKVIQLLDKVPEYKIGYIIAYIQGITADDDTDGIFCENLLNDYLLDDDPEKHDAIPLAEFAKQEGVSL